MNKINLDIQIGTVVRKYLDKKFKGKETPAKIPNAYNYNETFSEEELNAVTDLFLNDVTNLSSLAMLPNLKNLTISTYNNLSLNEENQQILTKIPKLESLSINGYKGIESIDCFVFSEKLYSLSLTNCPDLKYVKNLNGNIDFFKCVGNYSVRNIQDIVFNTIINRDIVSDYVLDVSFAPVFFKNIKAFNKVLTPSSIEQMKLNIRFGEEISRQIHIHNYNVINKIQQKAAEISSQVISPKDDNMTKFSNLYLWVCKNVKYDFDGLNNPNRYATENGLSQGEKLGTNNYINGFLLKKCVCEGFSKTLQYLCAYNNIPTSLVLCRAGNDDEESKDFNHSILQVEDKGKALYCDITWDAMAYQRGEKDFRYFLLSEEEMGKDHKLITSNKPLPSATEINNSTKQNLINQAENRFL